MSKDDHDLIDEETLSNMTVVDLREMCKNLQLMVSGNKSKLIERIIESKGLEKPEKELEIEQVLLLEDDEEETIVKENNICLLYTSPSPRDKRQSRMPSSA